jgi:hypothetical protein
MSKLYIESVVEKRIREIPGAEENEEEEQEQTKALTWS